ncbi:MAG TPA: flagellin, partial [Phycisphaerae bacterium]|nr:flagellin [Phycisphaerae bacterium]
MARINTNVPAIVAQRTMQHTQRDLQLSLERLSSGLRINRGADDPAGLINSESLRADMAGTQKAIGNSQRAINIIATAEGALNEVASLLIDIQGLIVEIANDAAMSDDEKKANQLQIDSAIDSITRIADTTSFAGRKLINGSLSYITSGVQASALAGVNVYGVQFGTFPYIPVEVAVTTSAQKAELQFRSSQITSDVTLVVAGNLGTATFEFDAGLAASALLQAVNLDRQATGIEAYFLNNSNPTSGIGFRSMGYGTDQFVEVRPLNQGGSFQVADADGNIKLRDVGRDATGIINGASVTGRGLDLVLNSRTLNLMLTLNEDMGVGSTSFAITGGGALFQLGPDVSPSQQVNIGIQSVAAAYLGNTQMGFLTQIKSGNEYEVARSESNAHQASLVVREAIRQVAVLRGRLGS